MAIKKLFCFPKNIILEEYRQLFSFQMKNQLKPMQCKNKAMDKDRTQASGSDDNVFLCALGRQFGLIEFWDRGAVACALNTRAIMLSPSRRRRDSGSAIACALNTQATAPKNWAAGPPSAVAVARRSERYLREVLRESGSLTPTRTHSILKYLL